MSHQETYFLGMVTGILIGLAMHQGFLNRRLRDKIHDMLLKRIKELGLTIKSKDNTDVTFSELWGHAGIDRKYEREPGS